MKYKLNNLNTQQQTTDNIPLQCKFLYFNRKTKVYTLWTKWEWSRLRLKCDGTRAETRFLPSAKRTSPFKSAGASVQSTTGRRAVHISLQGLYCSCEPVFYSHVTLTGYPLHPLVSPSLLLPCFTVCHHISTELYLFWGGFSIHRENYKAAKLTVHFEHFVWVEQVEATGLQATRQMGHGRPTHSWFF
jgi:hypothetical protein